MGEQTRPGPWTTRMAIKLLLLYSLFILSACQEKPVGSKVGKSENRWYGAAPSSSLKHCRRLGCKVQKYPECCYHPVCARRQKRRCDWLNYLGGSVQPTQVSTATGQVDVLKTPQSVNEDLVDIGLRECLPGCDVITTPTCCFNSKCMYRKPKDCAWASSSYLRQGNMRNRSTSGRSDTESEISVTLCKDGSNETLSVEQLETDVDEVQDVLDAKCAFISYNNTTPNCNELEPHCDQRYSFATMACWRLNWCPRKIGNNHSLIKTNKKRFGRCCFHPDYKTKANQC